MNNPPPRVQLLNDAIDYVAEYGLADLSLRRLATELGTSHRMLIHYFGSKDDLWAAIVKEVERRQLAMFESMGPDLARSFPEFMRSWWRRLSDPTLWPNERLFFEVYAKALHDEPGTNSFLNDIVESWIRPSADLAEARGLPPEMAAAYARLGLAVTRGLLLDLLATQDKAAVDAAMEQWISMSLSVFEMDTK